MWSAAARRGVAHAGHCVAYVTFLSDPKAGYGTAADGSIRCGATLPGAVAPGGRPGTGFAEARTGATPARLVNDRSNVGDPGFAAVITLRSG